MRNVICDIMTKLKLQLRCNIHITNVSTNESGVRDILWSNHDIITNATR